MGMVIDIYNIIIYIIKKYKGFTKFFTGIFLIFYPFFSLPSGCPYIIHPKMKIEEFFRKLSGYVSIKTEPKGSVFW